MVAIPEKTIIHIVDDDASVRKALKRLLRSVGMEAETFDSVKAFFKSNYKENSMCLIVDLHMIGGTGFDLKKRLDKNGSTIPIIFITAHDSERTRKKVKEAGATGYLQKPFNDKSLLDLVGKALGKTKL